jgi:hypothetical protein
MREMVGLCRLELQTSCVSSRRSNQLSYRPLNSGLNWALTDIISAQPTDSLSFSLPCQGSALTN